MRKAVPGTPKLRRRLPADPVALWKAFVRQMRAQLEPLTYTKTAGTIVSRDSSAQKVAGSPALIFVIDSFRAPKL